MIVARTKIVDLFEWIQGFAGLYGQLRIKLRRPSSMVRYSWEESWQVELTYSVSLAHALRKASERATQNTLNPKI